MRLQVGFQCYSCHKLQKGLIRTWTASEVVNAVVAKLNHNIQEHADKAQLTMRLTLWKRKVQ